MPITGGIAYKRPIIINKVPITEERAQIITVRKLNYK